mgnify:CR=1 FL=1
MAELKRIIISIPDNLLKEFDFLASLEKTSRSEFVREAMKRYVKERRKKERFYRMKIVYLNLAEMNLILAEIFF